MPLVLLLLCGGIGLLAEQLARTEVPGPLIPGLGLAGLIAIAGIVTLDARTAPAAPAACALAAVAGFAVGRPWRDERCSGLLWPVACGAVAFAVAAAPSVMSGQASVLGFGKLDDSGIWLGLTDHLLRDARDFSGVPPSSYEIGLQNWAGAGYPLGSFTPFGIAGRLTGQDLANAYQPTIAVYVAICALALSVCVRPLVASPRRSALVGVIGVQASLFSGFVAWGSIKEICLAALIATLAALRPVALIALAAGAVIVTFGAGGLVFAVPAAAAGLLTFVRSSSRRTLLAGAAVLVVAVAPVLAVLGENLRQLIEGAPSDQRELGTLVDPLSLLQGAGLWPLGDFRSTPESHTAQTVIAVACLVLALAGMVLAARRRTWPVLSLMATALIGGGVAVARGAPWIDAKALAVASVLLLACAAAAVAAGPRRVAVAGLGSARRRLRGLHGPRLPRRAGRATRDPGRVEGARRRARRPRPDARAELRGLWDPIFPRRSATRGRAGAAHAAGPRPRGRHGTGERHARDG